MGKSGKSHKKRWKIWLGMVLCFLVSVVVLLYIMWCMDVGSIEGDYTVADLRQAAAGSEGSYELLLSLQRQDQDQDEPDSTSESAAAEVINEIKQIIQKHGGSPEEILAVLETQQEDEVEEFEGVAELGLTAEDTKTIYTCTEDFHNLGSRFIRDMLKENADALDLAWEHAEGTREVIKKLNKYPEISDETPAGYSQTIGSNRLSGNLRTICSLYQLKVFLECERGNYGEAIDILVEFASVPRKLLPNCRYMILKFRCFSLVQYNFVVANYILNLEGLPDTLVTELLESFEILTEEQLSVKNCLIYDYLCFKDLVTDEQKVMQALKRSGISTRRPGYLKVNSTLQLYRRDLFQEPIEGEVWPRFYPDSWDVFKDKPGSGKFTTRYRYYNPFGVLLFADHMQAYGRVRLLVRRLKLREEVFRLIGRKRLEPEFDLRAALAEKEFTVDREAGEIYLREYDDYGFLELDVTFEVNGEVLGIRRF